MKEEKEEKEKKKRRKREVKEKSEEKEKKMKSFILTRFLFCLSVYTLLISSKETLFLLVIVLLWFSLHLYEEQIYQSFKGSFILKRKGSSFKLFSKGQ